MGLNYPRKSWGWAVTKHTLIDLGLTRPRGIRNMLTRSRCNAGNEPLAARHKLAIDVVAQHPHLGGARCSRRDHDDGTNSLHRWVSFVRMNVEYVKKKRQIAVSVDRYAPVTFLNSMHTSCPRKPPMLSKSRQLIRPAHRETGPCRISFWPLIAKLLER